MSPKPETEPRAASRSAEPQRASAGVVSCRSSPTPVPRLEQGVPAGPFLEMWPYPLHAARLLSCWEGLQGAEEQLHLLRGQGEAGAQLGRLRQGRRACLGPRAEPGAQVHPHGHGHTPSTPRSPPPYTPRQCLSGFFPLLFPLLTALPPSSDEGMGDRLTAHFLAQQVMLACMWLGLH